MHNPTDTKQYQSKTQQDLNALQQEASDPNHSCFVSASAGTGKTKVLVDRFLRLMFEQHTKPQNILCITYTNTAADEVKARILQMLNKILKSNNRLEALRKIFAHATSQNIEKFDDIYKEFVENYQNLKIYTIHSFCYQILQQYWTVTGKTQLQILEPSAASRNISSVIDKSIINNKDSAMYLLAIYEIGYLQKVLKNAINSHSINGYSFELSDLAPNPARLFFESDACKELEAFLGIEFSDPGSMEKVLRETFLTLSGKPRKKIMLPQNCNQNLDHKSLLSFQDLICDLFEKITRYKFKKLNHHISILFNDALDEYSNFKLKNYNIDFNDILHQTLDTLENDSDAIQVLYQIDLTIDHILIDEAQDTSPIQWEIIKMISTEYYCGSTRRDFIPTVFVVGDFKQSIYSFQGANPDYFRKSKDYFKRVIESVGGIFKDITFNTSFRSEPAILKYVDKVFSQRALAHAICGQIQEVVHKAFKNSDGSIILNDVLDPESGLEQQTKSNYTLSISNTLIQSLALNSNTSERLKPEDLSPDQILAQQICDHIMFHVKHYQVIAGTNKAVNFGDIMVIFRKRSQAYYYLVELLNALAVPVTSNRNINMTTSNELKYIKLLLKFALFPYDDYNLYELLKSPFFELTNNEITDLFFERNKICGFNISQIRNPRLHKKLSLLLSLRNMDIVSFLNKIFINFNYINNFIDHFGISFKNTYDSILKSIKHKAQNKPISILEFYTSHIENLNISELFNNNFDGVKVITAHAAKGLQSKVVILADTTTTDNQPSDLVVENHESQILMFIPKKELQPIEIQEFLERKKLNEYCENLRLLYVSLTRAENEIHIFGRKSRNIKNSWYQILKDAYDKDLRAQCNFDQKSSAHSTKQLNNNAIYKDFYLQDCTALQQDVSRETFLDYKGVAFYNKGLQSGSIMHHFLHILPSIDVQDWEQISNKMPQFIYEFNLAVKILDKYPNLFYSDSNRKVLSEVEVAESLENNMCKKKYIIDKLIISDHEVKVIDFKNDTNVNENTIEKYRNQLLKYKCIIQNIYPNSKVSCYLLFCHHHEHLHEIV